MNALRDERQSFLQDVVTVLIRYQHEAAGTAEGRHQVLAIQDLLLCAKLPFDRSRDQTLEEANTFFCFSHRDLVLASDRVVCTSVAEAVEVRLHSDALFLVERCFVVVEISTELVEQVTIRVREDVPQVWVSRFSRNNPTLSLLKVCLTQNVAFFGDGELAADTLVTDNILKVGVSACQSTTRSSMQ
jgi:hypothetical protein